MYDVYVCVVLMSFCSVFVVVFILLVTHLFSVTEHLLCCLQENPTLSLRFVLLVHVKRSPRMARIWTLRRTTRQKT